MTGAGRGYAGAATKMTDRPSDADIVIPYQCPDCGHYILVEMENGKATCLWCKKEFEIK